MKFWEILLEAWFGNEALQKQVAKDMLMPIFLANIGLYIKSNSLEPFELMTLRLNPKS